MTRTAAAALAALLVTGVAACGDDDDEATSGSGTEEPASGVGAGFCDDLIEFNTMVMNVELDETSTEDEVKEVGEELLAVFSSVVDNAPEGMADAGAQLTEAITPMTEGDASAFNADTTFEAYSGFLADGIGECDVPTVEVTASDYAFEAPATVEAGNVSFTMANASDGEEHEMIVFRRADGVDLSFEELLALPEDEAMTKAEFVAATFAAPGEEGQTLATLTPGTYGMVCFIPVGGAEDGPPHFTQGMVTEFTVE